MVTKIIKHIKPKVIKPRLNIEPDLEDFKSPNLLETKKTQRLISKKQENNLKSFKEDSKALLKDFKAFETKRIWDESVYEKAAPVIGPPEAAEFDYIEKFNSSDHGAVILYKSQDSNLYWIAMFSRYPSKFQDLKCTDLCISKTDKGRDQYVVYAILSKTEWEAMLIPNKKLETLWPLGKISSELQTLFYKKQADQEKITFLIYCKTSDQSKLTPEFSKSLKVADEEPVISITRNPIKTIRNESYITATFKNVSSFLNAEEFYRLNIIDPGLKGNSELLDDSLIEGNKEDGSEILSQIKSNNLSSE